MWSLQVRRLFRDAGGFRRQLTPTHQAETGDPILGTYFNLQLRIGPQGLIEELGFTCPRCVPAIACGAYLHEQLVGQPLSSAQQLSPEGLLHALGGLPRDRLVYAWLAIQALQQALKGEPP